MLMEVPIIRMCGESHARRNRRRRVSVPTIAVRIADNASRGRSGSRYHSTGVMRRLQRWLLRHFLG